MFVEASSTLAVQRSAGDQALHDLLKISLEDDSLVSLDIIEEEPEAAAIMADFETENRIDSEKA